jgi:FkbH-like protein
MEDAAAIALEKCEWQAKLFRPDPLRRDITKLDPIWPLQPLRVRVHRNHAFEPAERVLAPYLAFAGYAAEIDYSAYDDSLTLSQLDKSAPDVELIWLDYTRLCSEGPDALAEWIKGRLTTLRNHSSAPILITNWAEHSQQALAFNSELRIIARGLLSVYVCDLAKIAEKLGDRFLDLRIASFSGSRLSNSAFLEAARLLGSCWIPGAVSPRLKAIVADLDNTLFDGVLGEDGPLGVHLTESHLALQKRLVELSQEGIYVAICSRNRPEDVEALFTQRPDFPLRPEHVSDMQISWEPKARGLRRIGETLRIGMNSILFMDDNPGELAAVVSELPEVHTLYAGPNAGCALNALRLYPRVNRLRADEADLLRAADLAANRVRSELASNAEDPASYLRSLKVHLRFTRNTREEIERLASLSNKTNQFNLALERLSAVQISKKMDDSTVVGIQMRDRLSDSGIIGLLVATRVGSSLVVEDLCISCRALGRNLENVMITEALKAAIGHDPAAESVLFRWRRGPRNSPALEWLARFTGGATIGTDGCIDWSLRSNSSELIAAEVSVDHLWRGKDES